MTPSALILPGIDAARSHGLSGAFALDGSLVHYRRAPRDRERDVPAGLETLACALEDDGWDLAREYTRPSAGGLVPSRLDFLRVTGRAVQRTDCDPWDDGAWNARVRRLERDREVRRAGRGPSPDAKMAGALARHRASDWTVGERAEREQEEAEASDANHA